MEDGATDKLLIFSFLSGKIKLHSLVPNREVILIPPESNLQVVVVGNDFEDCKSLLAIAFHWLTRTVQYALITSLSVSVTLSIQPAWTW